MKDNDYSKNKDWTMTVWVGGDPASPGHLQAQLETRQYLEYVFERHGKNYPLLRKAADLFSPTRAKAKQWEGISREPSLDFIDEKGAVYAAHQLRISRNMMPDSTFSSALHAMSAGRNLEDVARKYRTKLICADAPRFVGRLQQPLKNTTQNWSMSMVTNDPMRNHSVSNHANVSYYEDKLTKAVAGLNPGASPMETVREMIPEIAKQNTLYTFGEFDSIRPASGTISVSKIKVDGWNGEPPSSTPAATHFMKP